MATPARRAESPGVSAAWHLLDRTSLEARLGTSGSGLDPVEVPIRAERYGPNQLEEEAPPSALVILLHQFKSPLIYILLLAAAVTAAIGEYIDSAVIGVVLALNALIGFVQERRAELSVRALMQLVAPHARAIRGGREQDLESRELVPGDLVLLESGVRVPADLRLVSTTALQIDESLLTGESVPVAKDAAALEAPDLPLADRRNMAYAGSIVASGRGRGYVVATGAATELGSIAEHVRGRERAQTPLQHRMSRFATVVGAVVALAGVVVLAYGVARGEPLSDMFMVAVAMAVAVVPEGLPVVFTVTLALGVRRMARRHAIIRRLPAVETLGSTTVIGSDKTGTLTENRMTVHKIWAGGTTFSLADGAAGARVALDEQGEAAALPEHRPLYLTLLAGVLANEAHVTATADGLQPQGDPTETALLVAAARLGVDPNHAREAYRSEAEIPFEPDRRYSASFRVHRGEHLVFVKGAPERVLAMSDRMLGEEGPVPIEPDVLHDAARALAAQGLRVLAMAYRPLPDGAPSAAHAPEPGALIFLGLQGSMDPPRAGVREAIGGCHDAGIRVLMITGDHAATARAIAADLGIGGAGEQTLLTGPDLEAMDDAALRGRVRDVAVYARVSPEHKLRVVTALKALGEVVAVTGDGVNDAPALKAADIGIAMGKSGTDVAREASDMVLTDDNFVSIHAAVEEGRITFDNLRKVTFFLISTGAGALVAILAALFLEWPMPFLPAQLLWLNLVTNGLQDVALAFEPGEPGVLRRSPRDPREGIISRLLWQRTLLAGLVMAAGTLALFRWELDGGSDLASAQTVALTTMVIFQMFHVGNSRSEHRSILALNPFSNPFLFAATATAFVVHVAALYSPWTQFVLRVEPIGLDAWARIIAVAASIVVVIELDKLLRRRRGDPGATRQSRPTTITARSPPRASSGSRWPPDTPPGCRRVARWPWSAPWRRAAGRRCRRSR
jgi:magnesium-transporting ATPase (P-type)